MIPTILDNISSEFFSCSFIQIARHCQCSQFFSFAIIIVLEFYFPNLRQKGLMRLTPPTLVDRDSTDLLDSELSTIRYHVVKYPSQNYSFPKSKNQQPSRQSYDSTWHLQKNKVQEDMVLRIIQNIEAKSNDLTVKETEKENQLSPRNSIISQSPKSTPPNVTQTLNIARPVSAIDGSTDIHVPHQAQMQLSNELPKLEKQTSPIDAMDISESDVKMDPRNVENNQDNMELTSKKAPIELITDIPPPKIVDCESHIFEKPYDYYLKLVEYHKDVFLEIKKDKLLKNKLFKIKMSITKIIGQIKDDEFMMKRALMTLKQHIKEACDLNQPVFVFVLIGKLFVKQAQAECGTFVGKALPLSKVLIQLIVSNPFHDFIISRLVKKCPGLLTDQWLDKSDTNGVFALFTGLCIESKQTSLSWKWIAFNINQNALFDVQSQRLSTIIELATPIMKSKYKNQYSKLIRSVLDCCKKVKSSPQVEQLILMCKKSI
eukprot:NODE_510_length_6666_cov_0.619918.p1 type:complete len:488 gc:universal NODE_510_length_6666_cov_0.619918:3826-5289(+)